MTNKQLAGIFFEEFFNKHDQSAIDKYMSPDYVQHDYGIPPGIEGFRSYFAETFERFPDFRVDVKHIIADGDMVAIYGYGVTDPGRIEVLVADIYRVQDGKLAEHWDAIHFLPPEQFGNPILI